tara:strand:+ start:165 stop:350 length:186 start_codon:yes stop_codon:yes gene_type:complete
MSSYNIFDNETTQPNINTIKTKSNIKINNKQHYVSKIKPKKIQINYKKNKDMPHIQRKYKK